MKQNSFYNLIEMLNLPEPEWLLDGMIPTLGLGVMYGPPGVGKSFIAMDMALKIASYEQGALYIAAEGGGGYGSRLRAWCSYHQLSANLPIMFMPFANLNLGNEEDIKNLIINMKHTQFSPALVVIDTLARCMSGNENSAGDMGEAIRHVGLLAQKMNCFILLVHHSTKGSSTTMRGSGALHGACDVAIQIEREYDVITVSCKKAKYAREFKDYQLCLQPVLESCVVVPVDKDFQYSNMSFEKKKRGY